MDVTLCLKSLLLAVHQHRDGGTLQTEAQLLRRLEETSALRCGPLLSSGQQLPAECVGALLDVAGNPTSSSVLTGSIVTLLGLLAGDACSRTVLHSSLSGTLAAIIQRSDPQEPLVLQCVQLLQRLSYSSSVFQSSSSVQQLVSFLIANIQAKDEVLMVPCLGLLANLCRRDYWVQTHIRSLDKVRTFYRTLLNLLDHHSLTVVIFSLSILASLTLREEVGRKLFGPENIQQTFQLVFNILVNGGGTLTMKFSVDLLVALLSSRQVAASLSRFQHFSACVTQVLGLLKSKDPETAAKVLELLLTMCRVSSLRPLVCQVFFRPAGPRPEGQDQAGSGLVLVQWLSSPVQGAESCSLQVLDLLKELLEEALGGDPVSDWTLSFLDLLLPVLLDLLRTFQSGPDLDPRRACMWTSCISLLLHDPCRPLLARRVSAALCLSQVQTLLSCCHGNGSPGNRSVCSEAVLQTVALMSKLKQVKDMETTFYRVLQDHRMVTPLSQALTSPHRENVHRALMLLTEAAALPDFPSELLGESIAANNLYRQKEAELSVKPAARQEAPPTSVPDQSGPDGGVSCLVEKVQSGLEVKDSHVSDIIQVFQQKEARLLHLLEAKAEALSQCERLNAKYSLQLAQAQAETDQLASLLKEAELGREEVEEELRQQVEVVRRSEADAQELLRHNARLQRHSEEHQALKAAYNTLLCRLGDTQRLLKELQEEHGALSRNQEALTRSQEALQLQLHRLQEVLQEKEEEIKTLRSDLQEKHQDVSGLQAELRAQEEKVQQVEQQRRDLEESLDLLRGELHKTEQARKEASIKASSLELQKIQVESKLQQKEEELNKHSAMIAMIHSLSSAKTRTDGNLSL